MTQKNTDPQKVEESLHKDNLTTKQLNLIPIILKGDSMESVAKEAGIERGTIYRWLKDPAFKQRLEEARQEVFEDGLNRLKTATDKAAQKMIELLDSKDPTARRLAAKDILTFAFRSFETRELEARIERIEGLIEKRFIS